MSVLKRLTVEGVPRAMQKAERYRLLGEPLEAESICIDVLQIDPGNHEARILLILSLSDRFATDFSYVKDASRIAAELEDEYERLYYRGIVAERLGKARLNRAGPSSDDYANRALREAMTWYERAEAVRAPGDDDAILRWNTCVRVIERRGFTQPPDMLIPTLATTE
jgi:hypothetical protein